MDKIWKHMTGDSWDVDVWVKDKTLVLILGATVVICPVENCEDHYERTDAISWCTFAYTLVGIALGIQQGSQIVRDNFTRDDALWMLGWLNVYPTVDDSERLRDAISHERLVNGWSKRYAE